MGAAVVSGVKVRQEVAGELLDKSYSPTSPAERPGTFDLLVKAHARRRRKLGEAGFVLGWFLRR